MGSVGESIRHGDWLTRERIKIVAWMLLGTSAFGIAYLVLTSNGLNDFKNRPLGTDFSNVYAAGTYALEGQPAAPYDPVLQHERERQIFGADTPFYGWPYPPFFLFIAAPLALMPYLWALLVWQAASFAVYLGMIRRVIGKTAPDHGVVASDRLWLLLAAAFPAVFVNFGHGHNGLLTAALLGSALLALHPRPVLSGVLFGLIAYKPQFGLMIPLALIAGGHWCAFAAAAATVAAMCLISTLVFGAEVWHAMMAWTGFTRQVVLEAGDTGWHKIQSVFSWTRMWGAPVPLAYAVQGLATLGVAGGIVWLWHSRAAFPLKAAALCVGTILATPYSLDYDMMVLAPAIAFLAAHGLAQGFAPFEKTALALLWLAPLITRSVAEFALVPLGVAAMLIVLFLTLRKALLDQPLRERLPASATGF